MPTLLVIILPSGDPGADSQRTISSVEDIADDILDMEYDEFVENQNDIDHDWFLCLYDVEALSVELANAIPVYIEEAKESCLVLLRRVIDEDGNHRFYQSPRMFRKGTRIREDSLIPEDENTPFTTILDGWLDEQRG